MFYLIRVQIDFFYPFLFANHLICPTTKLGTTLEVEIADGSIEIDGYVFPANLLPMEISGFDVVIGTDWLGKNEDEIVCSKKIV